MSDAQTSDGCKIICPHCGYAHGDAWEWRTSEDERETECAECDASFRYWAVYDVTYYADKIDTPDKDVN